MATRMTKSDNMDSHNALSDNVTANTAFSSRFHASSSQDITDPQASFKTVEHSTDRLPHSPPVSAKRRRTSLDKTNRSTLDIIGLSVTSQAAAQNVAPYLAKHIPTKYNPEGGTPSIASTMETKPIYCNRHRPDTKCWRQANEPTMEELQNELNILDTHDQQGISHVWSLFSTAPSKQRKLMLQGILAVCCFPQLSFVSATVRDLIKIDFISMLPTELSFKVLSYLDTISLCKAAQVSRRWNELAEDDVVWHKMCEQHIAKKCKKCGWGLPLLDQKRLLKEKRVIERRAQGIARSETTDTSREGSESPCDHSNMPGNKRPLDDITESPSKKIRTDLESNAVIQRQAWKEVYKTRFKIGTNWKYGRHRLKVLKGHRNGVMCLQFQDNILATGSYDATIKIWDLDTGKELRTLEGHTSGVRCLQFFNCQLISGAMDKTIRIWNWKTGQCVRVLSGPTGDVLSVNFNNRYLCSGGKDNMVRVWNFEEKINYILRGHSDFVNSVRLDGPSRTLFSGSDDATVRLWDLNNGHLLRTYRGHVGGIQQVVLLPPEFDVDEFDLLDCDHNSDSEEEANRSCARCPFPDDLPNHKIFPNDPSRPNPPNFMLTASLDSTIRLWHVPTERCLRTFFGHLEGIWALAADNLRVVSGAEDRMVKIWDPRSGKCERTFTGHAGPVTTVGLSGDLLITGSEDCEIRVMEFGPTEEE